MSDHSDGEPALVRTATGDFGLTPVRYSTPGALAALPRRESTDR